ncbi:hypothetical protein [Infirmifilum sp. SLHALR2]
MRVTPAEKERLRGEAEEGGLNPSEYLPLEILG